MTALGVPAPDPLDIALHVLTPDQLPGVTGGQEAAPAGAGPAFGRCGPEDRWRFLGDVYTPECRTHDASVRGAIANGSSRVGAHVRALPQLPAAIWSYARERFSPSR
jgi:hypothetical protein